MSLLNDASLVLIPSGYKEDKVYSIIPSDGSGDLDFVRGSEGTRINSLGQVERTPWNLLQYSEQPTNAAWVKQNSGTTFTLTDNFTTAPNGTNTACKYTWTAMDASGKYFAIYTSLSNYIGNLPITFSVYMKGALGGENIYIYGNNYESIQLVTLTTEWVRYQFTFDTSLPNIYCYIGGEFGAAGMTSLSAGTAYIWGAQLNVGSTAKPYFPTTDRLNVPRLTYENGCPSLLLEKQSTNLALYSEQLDNYAWLKIGISVTANNIVSPDGTQNADKLIASAGTSTKVIYQGYPAGTNTASIYAKAGELGGIGLAIGTMGAFFNLTTGQYRSNYLIAPVSYSITSVGNGWYKISVTFTSLSNDNLYIVANDNVSNTLSITGNGSDGIYTWGAQLEASAYPTSYIPTTSTSVTRLADSCSKTGISSLIGQTSGTMFVDFIFSKSSNDYGYLSIQNASANSRVRIIYIKSTDTMQLDIVIAGSAYVLYTFTPSHQQRYKIAIAYESGDTTAYINGANVGSDTTSFTFTDLSSLNFDNPSSLGDQPLTGKHNQALLFQRKLTSQEAIALTTL